MKIYGVALFMVMLVACSSAPVAQKQDNGSLPAIENLAAGGDRGATHDLCYRYAYGRGVPLDYPMALKWCKQGAALGIDSSQVLLAEMYYNGQGTTRDYAQALIWYRAAAAQGHEHALLMLYHVYNDGTGVPQDRGVALAYLKKGADAGYQLAIDEMATQLSGKKP